MSTRFSRVTRLALCSAASVVSGLVVSQVQAQPSSSPGGGSDAVRNLTWHPLGDGGSLWSTNPASTNWLDGVTPTFFANGDIAHFTDDGLSFSEGTGLVSIAGVIGVQPGATHVSNTTGLYGLIGGPIAGDGALIKSGDGGLLLDNVNTYTGGTVINGGAILVKFNQNLGTLSGGITLGGGTLNLLNPVNSIRPISLTDGSTSSINAGSGTSTFTTVSGGGTLVKQGGGRLHVTHVRAHELEIAAGEVRIPAGPVPVTAERVSDVNALRIAGGPTAPVARFDLTNNAIIVGSLPLAAGGALPTESRARDYIRAGYADGAWTGMGIATSAGDSDSFALGYAEAGELGLSTFMGLDVGPEDVLIRFTRYGDADLDGVVNLNDFNRLAAGFGSTGASWRDGDFNYDGVVNLADFNHLAANFGLSASGPEVTPDDWSTLAAAVPEPVSMTAILAGALLGLHRPRRTPAIDRVGAAAS